MPQYDQLTGILSARHELDDQYNSKHLFQFKPLQGTLDGSNKIFQIPQQRIVVYKDNVMNLFPQLFKNNAPLVFNTDYELLDPLMGVLQYDAVPPPTKGDDLTVSFNWVWFTDIEWDHFLNRAANEIGFTLYYTSGSVAGTEPLPPGGSQPSDIPDGLFNAIVKLAAALGAESLATRFSTRYDTSAGDQSFSPSQMAKSFSDISEKRRKEALNARDDYYKGQGRQYRPVVATAGYILPNWTPVR